MVRSSQASSLVWRTQRSVSKNCLWNLKGKTWLASCFGVGQRTVTIASGTSYIPRVWEKERVNISHGADAGQRAGIRFMRGVHRDLNILHPTETDVTTRHWQKNEWPPEMNLFVKIKKISEKKISVVNSIFLKTLESAPSKYQFLYILSPENTTKPTRFSAA